MSAPPSVSVPSLDGLPRTFGPYTLLALWGRGGMGDVFLAKQALPGGLERVCAVKKLRGRRAVDEGQVRRFLDEMRVVLHLSHAHICRVLDVGFVDGEWYAAMELVPGKDVRELAQRLAVQGRGFPQDVALLVVAEVLEALDSAHAACDPLTGEPLRVVHRDVSPQNVLLSYDGEAKLIDFGLCVSSVRTEQTAENIVMGKIAYMSPEQARGEAVDGTTDVFATAILAYELLTGERFYGAASSRTIWQVAGTGGFRPEGWGGLDPELRGLLDRALAIDPSARFSSAGELAEALRIILALRHPGAGRGAVKQLVRDALGAEIDEERARMKLLASLGPARPRAA